MKINIKYYPISNSKIKAGYVEKMALSDGGVQYQKKWNINQFVEVNPDFSWKVILGEEKACEVMESFSNILKNAMQISDKRNRNKDWLTFEIQNDDGSILDGGFTIGDRTNVKGALGYILDRIIPKEISMPRFLLSL